MFDRLVGRAVLAEADRIVGQHINDALAHHRRQPQRRTQVIRKDQESSTVGDQAAVKGDTVAAPGWGPVSEEQVTLAEIMTHAGYRTGLVTDVYHQMKPSTNFHRGFSQFNWIRGQEGDKYRSSCLISPESVGPFLHPSYPPDAMAYRRTRLKQYLASINNRHS